VVTAPTTSYSYFHILSFDRISIESGRMSNFLPVDDPELLICPGSAVQNRSLCAEGRPNHGTGRTLHSVNSRSVGLTLIQKTINCDQSCEAESLILPTHKVLTEKRKRIS
jgi:hypothetical protein